MKTKQLNMSVWDVKPKGRVYCVDGAASMADIEISDEFSADMPIRFPGINHEYKFVTLIESPNGTGLLLPICSKDFYTWTLCYGAEVRGELVDVYKLCTGQLDERR